MCDWKHHWPECDHIGRKLFDTHAVFVEHAKMVWRLFQIFVHDFNFTVSNIS